MVAYKNITKLISVIVTAAVLVCILALMFPARVAETFGGGGVALGYETKLFDTSRIIQLDIQMDETAWEDMLANASGEEYYACDVVINDEKLYNVGIRPKGNTSLSSIVMDPDSDRYSLKLEFDHYVDGQSCFGLDKLILNNNYADATNMKEALAYDMFQYLGADASLYNYAKVSVNGEYWGVYLALEAVEDSFQLRNYGTADGELYKPENMGGPGGDEQKAFDGRQPVGDEQPNDGNQPNDGDQPHNGERGPGRGGMPGGGFSKESNGADLNYTDDNLDSYSSIWEGEVTGTGKKDHRKVVTALKNISEGKDLEQYLDVDNVLKYMAVHVFSVNLDSLSGNMTHNYYLYENNGKLNILPWDYNLSFGGMGMGAGSGASGTVNDPIDTPFESTKFFDALLEDEEYLSRYHEYLRQLADDYAAGGRFEEFYNRVRSQIDPLAETDPTAFYSFEEYKAGAEMLYETVMLRAESIRGQLNGTIPSTDEGQRGDSISLVDASSIDIDAMGSFHGGGKERDGEERIKEWEGEPAMEAFREENILPGEANGFHGNVRPENMPGGPPQDFGGPDGTNGGNAVGNLIMCGICLLAAILALVLAKHYQRIPRKRQG